MMRLFTIPALVLIPACVVGHVGSGDAATETRDIDGATGIVSSTMVHVTVSPGEQRSFELTCDDNLLDEIEVEVESDGMLIVRATPGVTLLPRTDCTAEVVLPELFEARSDGSGGLEVVGDFPMLARVGSDGSGALVVDGTAGALTDVDSHGSGAVEIAHAIAPEACGLAVLHTGSGRVVIDELEACNLEVVSSGSGGNDIRGQIDSVAIDLSGSGGVKQEGLVAREADITISGSGGVEMTVVESLRARLSGSGGATIHGDPSERDIQETGSGRVRFE